MGDLCRLIWCPLIGLFRPRAALEAEILILRHQLNVLRRRSSKRVTLSSVDRPLLVGLYRLAPEVLDGLKIIRPETLLRWRCAGFRAFWRWKSRPRGGRPRISADICCLIREMSVANPLWGAPRIHGRTAQARHRCRTDHGRKVHGEGEATAVAGLEDLLRNHADGIASMDLFLVPTISFRLLYGLLILQHSRRKLLWLGVTAHPSAEWIARQLTEAYGWQQAPRYVIRDRDCAYNGVFLRQLRAMGIRDRPISLRSPWQNGCAERLIGSLRRDCLDHVIVFGERHLRHLLKSYQKYYNEVRTHPVIAQGRADSSRRPDRRSDLGRANFGRATPPIYPSVSFRQGQVQIPPAAPLGKVWSFASVHPDAGCIPKLVFPFATSFRDRD
jgi:hypothetical protein